MNQLELCQKLTNRDLDIMTILWHSPKSMTASEIVTANPALNINTVQAVLRKLLKNELIKVADIVYSGTVLSRSYIPTVLERDFALVKICSEYEKLGKNLSKADLLAALFDADPDKERVLKELNEIEELLDNISSNKKDS